MKFNMDKVKKSLYGLIGAAAGSAVVIAITAQSLMLNVFNINVVEDTLYYTVDVEVIKDPEDTTETQDFQVRLVTSSQFGEDYYDISLGLTEGVIENLYLDTTYTIWVEYDNGITWTKIEEKTFKTDQQTEVFVSKLYETGDIRNSNRHLVMNLESFIAEQDKGLVFLKSKDIEDLNQPIILRKLNLEFDIAYQETLEFEIVVDGEVVKSFNYVMREPIDANFNVVVSRDNLSISQDVTYSAYQFGINLYQNNELTNVLFDQTQNFDLNVNSYDYIEIYAYDEQYQYVLFELDINQLIGLNYIYTTFNLTHTMTIIEDYSDIYQVLYNENIMQQISFNQTTYVYEIETSDVLNTISIEFDQNDKVIYQIDFIGE